MFKSITPILYYSPSIINQIQISYDKGLVITESTTHQTRLTNYIKILINKLFIPFIGAETATQYDKSKAKQINKQFDDLSRAVMTVKDAQKEILESVSIFDNNCSIDNMVYIEGVFKLQVKKSVIDDSFFVSIECPFGEYIIKGVTSIENWISKSLINHLLMCGEVDASAIVFPLSIKEKTIQAKIVCIFIV